VFTSLPLNKEATFPLLQDLLLSDQAWEIIALSFRTRVKEAKEGVISFQFRILPEHISENQKNSIDAVRDELIGKLTKQYPDFMLDVVIQVSPCCGTQCF